MVSRLRARTILLVPKLRLHSSFSSLRSRLSRAMVRHLMFARVVSPSRTPSTETITRQCLPLLDHPRRDRLGHSGKRIDLVPPEPSRSHRPRVRLRALPTLLGSLEKCLLLPPQLRVRRSSNRPTNSSVSPCPTLGEFTRHNRVVSPFRDRRGLPLLLLPISLEVNPASSRRLSLAIHSIRTRSLRTVPHSYHHRTTLLQWIGP